MKWEKLKKEAKNFALKKIEALDFNNHERFILKYVGELAPKYGGNQDLLEVATYLHDLGWFEDENDHANASARIARKFLTQYDVEERIISDIEKTIISHEATGKLQDTNSRILRAADGLAIVNNIPYMFFLSWDKDKLGMSYLDGMENFAKPMITSALKKIDGLDKKLVDSVLREYIQSYMGEN